MAGRGCAAVIGIGNPNRGDDAVGRAVARWLRARVPAGTEVLEHDGEAASLLACLEGFGSAWLVDACCSGYPPGSVHRFDVATAPLPPEARTLSTHGLGLAEAIELARALGRLPGHCIVYAVEGASFGVGAPLSPSVAAAVAEAGNRVLDELFRQAVPEGRRHR